MHNPIHDLLPDLAALALHLAGGASISAIGYIATIAMLAAFCRHITR